MPVPVVPPVPFPGARPAKGLGLTALRRDWGRPGLSRQGDRR